MLEIKELYKTYKNGTNALRDVNLVLSEGSIICLAGPNGSGKTTTFRLLASLIQPSSGSIFYNNLEVNKNNLDFKSMVGYLPERCGYYNRFSGLWNLNFYASLFHQRFQLSDWQHYAKLLNIEKYLDKPVGIYSFGTKQKLGILRTLVIRPTILLFDEPFNGLDIESQEALKIIFLDLIGKQNLVVISTHLISTIEDIANSLIILYEGTKILDLPVPMIRNEMKTSHQFKSITDYYLFSIKGYRNEVK